MDRIERREFVRKHRTCVFGYNRKADGPAMTVVYYVMDGDDLLISTMAARAKALAVQRNPKSACASWTSSGPSPTCRSTGTPRSRRTLARPWTCCAGSST